MLAALDPLAVGTLVLAGVIALFLLLTFNAFVRLRNRVGEAFSGVDVQLKRRHDLVPNLVRVVKGYAAHERSTLEEVISARGEAEEAEQVGERARKENGLSHSLDRLFALVEQYPELKADRNFRKLHDDLVQIENDLQYARRYYNGTVRDFNTRIQQFPANLLAGALGVKQREFFELDAPGERRAPGVAFDAAPSEGGEETT